MIDQDRVLLMTKLARFEKGKKGKEALQMHKYYRSDFLALALIKTFFLTTIGYGLVLGVMLLANMTFFMDNFNLINIRVAGSMILIGYLVLLGLSMAVGYLHALIRYDRARKLMKEYLTQLEKLSDM